MAKPTSEELASRGKKAEAAVAKFLKKRKDSDVGFDYQRQYDARTARGRFPSQVGDYLIWRKMLITPHSRLSAALEVKTVAHDFRLPNKNFGAEQIAKLRRRQMAGCEPLVLVFHSTSSLWSIPPFIMFELDVAAPSWDLSSWSNYESPEKALIDAAPDLFKGIA